MKKKLLFLIALIISLSLIGQNEATGFQNHKLRKKKNAFEKPGRFTHSKAEQRLLSGPKINFNKNTTFKSTQTDKQRLDSLIYKTYNSDNGQMEVSLKSEFTYDVNGNSIMEIDYYWDNFTNLWVGYYKYEYTYDAVGNMTMEIEYDWDYITNQWVGYTKIMYTYDVYGNNTTYTSYNWDNTTSQWVSYYKYEYTYDVNGNMTMENEYNWDITTNQWVSYYKYEYTYDVNGNNTMQIHYGWDNDINQWITYSKNEYAYDVNSNNTTEIVYYWDNGSNQWDRAYKYEYTYDINGNTTMEIGYNWDNTTSLWVGFIKYENTYDVNSNNTLEIAYYWDNDTNQWLGVYKYEYTFDVNGNNTLEVDYYWDSLTNEWVREEKTEFDYNNSYSFGDLILPNFDEEEIELWRHMITSAYLYTWNGTTSIWDNYMIVNLYYSSQTISSIPNQSSKIDFEVYPNPASDYIVFDLQNKTGSFLVEFFDVTGRNVLNHNLSNNNKVNVSSLKRGIYIYKLTVDGEPKSGKITIR